MLKLADNPTRFLFFTGKGGVGKTSLACAVALKLADSGKSVLLVSTDPASNLDEMLGAKLDNAPTPIPGAPHLFAMNIDPDEAAEDYRRRVIEQMAPTSTDSERSTVREELSGACTTEIAAFDEFVGLLADDESAYDHIIFDTAPTGHTLRLLSLPKAWTGFLKDNDRGASCLGPHSGLKMREARFRAALATLGNAALTTIMLVTRADRSAIREAARTSDELRALGLANQRLAINGIFHATDRNDAVAHSIEALGEKALASMPENLEALPQDRIPLRPFDMVGLAALRALLSDVDPHAAAHVKGAEPSAPAIPKLDALVDELAAAGRGLVMVMGKGGVGKTTIAAALAIGLVQRGHSVHLSTTDPAAHITATLDGNLDGLQVDRIDPKAETDRYIEKIMATRGKNLDGQERDLMLEDLKSPCTEEVAVFHAFSRVVAEARSNFVVLDTAPTGHTLLLMDATGAYHRQMMRDIDPGAHGRIITPMMRLQDPDYTKIILVTLPETTPVSEAASLQEDLRRAKVEPYAWVINRSLAATATHDPLLRARIAAERVQIERVGKTLARRLFLLPWQAEPPVGVSALSELVSG
ncbi:arsenical pump-driving ATPase [Parvibaculum sp.]|uniref:arsenical pump-driving ATPase n=1 Tax=Parvibaculum sp. TaxID=2024848 RepID=UPI00320E0797